ncbi:hypothetical protein [Microbulbifer sp. VAAF005]|uniref:hypothetical protein n=1 Tax=Microbulbifer sp. VAAF005 TaxID=3034230 RepID=UPI0024AC91C5|nr:hypothetical protein [Microbulbifer sp. VAAF005]WHI45017.1 hypothetical protein P0078_14890 [Microbulbifer sp. VAAF005]WHI46785.1 hypothetical protein P0078_24325 [Microbulbifer sp. VAAF005]
MERQRSLRLIQGEITEAHVFNAYQRNSSVNTAVTWEEVLHSPALFHCLALEAKYTYRGQAPREFTKSKKQENAMRHTTVLDAAQVAQIKLALMLCRERINCPNTTTVKQGEASQELQSALDIFRAHDQRNGEIKGVTHV